MWHANSREVRGLVPILRTDNGLPPKVIENLNYRHEFRGGLFRIEIYTCTVRDGHDCPGRKFSGCGKLTPGDRSRPSNWTTFCAAPRSALICLWSTPR